MKQWKILYQDQKSKIKNQKFSSQEILKILLKNRGLKTKKEIDEFLNPQLEDVTLKSCNIDAAQVKKTVARIEKAIRNNESIVIFGDYDVDGICATAILWETLYRYTKTVYPYIPGRFEEGYGLSIKGIENIKNQISKIKDVSLLITVDNGIVAYEAARFAKDEDIDVIITDHHTVGEKLPDAYSIVHTAKLCGTGVAYLLSKEIKNNISQKQNSYRVQENEDTYLELVALATVADLVPLVGPNRTLLKFGLEKLLQTKRPGLRMLFQIAGVEKKQIGVYEIGHIIAPRLNAAGRLFSAMDALRLICTKSPARATELAQNLDATNRERQHVTTDMTSHAKLKLLTQETSRITFVHHTEYNEGVIGLVASRLVEEFYKPAFVVAVGEKISKGSARSINGVNIIEMIRSVDRHIIQAGGHPMAAGFTVETAKLALFRQALEEKANELVMDEYLNRVLVIDLELPFKNICYDLYDNLQCLAPFGMKNPEPVFLSREVIIEEVKPLGRDGKHLRLKLSQKCLDGSIISHPCIAFGIGERFQELTAGTVVDIAYAIDENTWNGKTTLQVKIKDIKRI